MEFWRKTTLSESYEVSSRGRVRSIDRYVNCCGGKRKIKGKVLSPHIVHSTGYEQVVLEKRNKQSVHRLVALAFVPGHKPGLVVNHKNGDRRDNHPSNLEWVTRAQNNLHAYRSLGRKAPFQGKSGAEHSTSKPLVMTEIATGKTVGFQCGLDATRSEKGLDSGSISRCCHGEYKTHKGRTFRFATDEEAGTITAFGAQHGVVFKEDREKAD